MERRYDCWMCSYAEWENLARRVEEAVEEGRVRDLVADAAARIDALLDSLMGWACPPEDRECVRGRGPRSRPEWVV
jgi:hypothetical protein